MDGYEATRAIRKLEQDKQLTPTPIIALTAHAMKEHQDKCRESGMNDHLSKPIEMRHLRDKLAEHLNGKTAQTPTSVKKAAL